MEEKYQIDTDANRQFLREMRKGLLAFGRKFPSPGGASYYLGDDGEPWKERPRELWITCRMAHVYSIGAMLGFSGAETLADAALQGLSGELRDTENGGWYPGVTAGGESLPEKQCYGHAFVLLAASSGLLAHRPGAEKLLEDALRLFDLRFWDEANGLTIDTWDTGFHAAQDYRGLNANMHTVEAFLAVADAAGREEYRLRAGRMIDRVIGWAQANDWRIPEHYTADWELLPDYNSDKKDDQFKPYGATPGHGIEWARLIAQWAASMEQWKTLPQGKYEEYLQAAERLYRRAIADAWDVDGAEGIVYTTDWTGAPVVHDRMHWTVAEAVNTSATLYRLTQDARYAADYAVLMRYTDRYLYDREHGSWYHQLDRTNRVLDTVWPGKPDVYHAFQATLIPYTAAGVSIASAIARDAQILR